MGKRQDYISWDEYFMALAILIKLKEVKIPQYTSWCLYS